MTWVFQLDADTSFPYELYEQHGARNGHALDDWLQAEYEVLRQRGVVGLALPHKRVVYR